MTSGMTAAMTAAMIRAVFRTGWLNLRRDRPALLLTFVLPIAFFSIFAGIFGQVGGRRGTPRIRLAVVDEDKSRISTRLVTALQAEPGLNVQLKAPSGGATSAPYSAQSAEAAVRSGTLPVALIIPKGFGASPVAFDPAEPHSKLLLLADTSDPVAAQMVTGLLQKALTASMPDVMAETSAKYFDQWTGGLSPEQRRKMDDNIESIKKFAQPPHSGASTPAGTGGGALAVEVRDVLGESKRNPVAAFYAAGIGVMFLLFSASGAGGALLEEAESGTLDRVLASRVSMRTLLLGKLLFLACMGMLQLFVMFLWGALVFKVELFSHFPGFLIMTAVTALAAAALGLLLAAACRTRGQLGAVSTLVILMMSALGGSMFPRFLIPETLQKVGLITFNAWALDGFLKVFWREEPLWRLWPQVTVLLAATVVFFTIARRLARRWEIV